MATRKTIVLVVQKLVSATLVKSSCPVKGSARFASSAASAANAVIDSVKSIVNPTKPDDWHSVCVVSDGSYNIEKDIICSFPVRSNGQNLEIVQGLQINEFSQSKINATVNELKEEKAMATELGLIK